MIMDFKIKTFKKISLSFVVVLTIFFTSSQALASKGIESFLIEGNQRIEESAIISYSGIRKGDPFDQNLLNKSLKSLYATGLFADVALFQKGESLVIKVAEKPIINEIRFEGNDALATDILMTEIQLRPRQVLTRTKIQIDVNRLKEVYRMSGHFAVIIDPKIIQLEQNRVNLVFEVTEGEETFISSIRFIGNKHYSTSSLEDVIMSEEQRWYKFWASNDKYDPDRINYDEELLRRFYLENGYVDFKVEAAVAELSPDQRDFFITFSLNEGERYKVGGVNIKTNITDLDIKDLEDTVTLESGEWYSSKEIEKTINAMTNRLGNMQFAFVDIRPGVNRNSDSRVVDVDFIVNEGKKTFIENINVSGNTRTLDEVVRREFTLIEGDPYNRDKITKTEQNIKNLNFFNNVKVKPVAGSGSNKTNIDVEIEEKSTGSMSIGFGYSTTEGPLSDLKISERNFLGKGQRLAFSTTLATERTEFDFSFAEPYFLNRKLLAGIDVFHITQDLQEESSYDNKLQGGALHLGYPLAENWRQNLSYRYENGTVENVQSTASSQVKAEEGTTVTSYLSLLTTYDSRDSYIDTTDGLITMIDTRFAGVGGDEQYYRLKLTSKYYYPIIDKWVFSLLGEAGFIQGWGGEGISIGDRFALGGDNLRGFKDQGVGTRDSVTDDALGGNNFWRGSVELGFPSGLPDELGIRAHVFSDFGSLWGVDGDNTNVYDASSVRASAGVGIAWKSPFGMIKMNLAEAFVDEDFDQKQKFRISFDTRL